MLINESRHQGVGADRSRADRWATLGQGREQSILGELSVLVELVCRAYAPNPACHAVGVTKASTGKPYPTAEVLANNPAVLPNTQRRASACHLAKTN